MLLLHHTEHDVPALEARLARSGHRIRSVTAQGTTLLREVETFEPDVIIVAADDPSRDLLEQVCVCSQFRERPIVMFTEAQAPEAMKKALRAGVAAYVVAGLSPERLESVLAVAIERFEIEREQFAEAEQLRRKLEEQRLVSRAKALLRRRGLSEPQAYAWLRREAMNRRCSIAELARELLG
ncbi:MAG: ANTAR domain-containing protein [Casimicrobiaceae bacterium]|nr:ANTAR domain-containing protein [Casimicrobiaceae bacterium]